MCWNKAGLGFVSLVPVSVISGIVGAIYLDFQQVACNNKKNIFRREGFF